MDPAEYHRFSLKDLSVLPKLNLALKNFDTWHLVVGPILTRYGILPILEGTAGVKREQDKAWSRTWP